MNRNLWLLAICQGLFLTNNVTFIAINGLVGLSLAPLGWMATLPVMGYVVGGALSTPLVARTQTRFGRKGSFQIGLAVAFASALLCAYAAISRNFWLLCAATVVAGYYNANAGLYRFAAAELAAPSWREKAVSLVMAGGLLGAVLGPNLAARTRTLLDVPFAGAYFALAVVALVSMAVLSFIAFPPTPARKAGASGRPLGEIMRQPIFIVAAATGALSYGVMNLLMAATPIAMQQCGLPFGDAALVLEWHVIGMFAPGFFTGHLIKRLGARRAGRERGPAQRGSDPEAPHQVRPADDTTEDPHRGALVVMGIGIVLYAGCIAVALSGLELRQFLFALLMLGVGWNFLFTGSTTLSLLAYTPEEKDRAQGALNFFVFATLALSSFASGVLVTTQGWRLLNLGSMLPVLLIGAGLLWLALQRRALHNA